VWPFCMHKSIGKNALSLNFCCLLVVRLQGKLDGYKEILKSGQDLNADQEIALERYEEVCNSLDLSRDYIKQFQTIANVANKEAKRERRKEAYLKQQNEIAKVREVLIIQDTLSRLKEEGMYQDFFKSIFHYFVDLPKMVFFHDTEDFKMED
jgi:Caprin-1 dimerization domain